MSRPDFFDTLRPTTALAVAMWFGLVTGVIEVAHQAIRMGVFGVVIPGPDEWFWLIPACHLLCYAVVGVVLAALVLALPALVTVGVVVFVCAWGTAWSQVLLHPALAGYAAYVLSAGIAIQFARIVAKRFAGFSQIVRRTLPLMMAGLALVAAGQPLVQGYLEDRRLNALPAPAAGAPNVLLIVLDTVRADNLEIYDHDNATAPTVKQLADEGMVFDWAISTASWTVPAHATMFTGRYTHEMSGANWLGALGGRYPTLAEIFGAHGYATGGFVGNVNYCNSERGMARGFSRYEDFYVNPITAALSFSFGNKWILGAVPEGHVARYRRNDAATVTSRFLDWVDGRGERPFFAFLNYFDAHALYLPPKGYDDLFGPPVDHLNDWRSRLQDWTPEEMDGYERAYDGCIRFIDDHIASIVEHLRAQGALDNTFIVVTSDHGEHFGEHGLVSHANSLYRQLQHVPLVLWYPPAIPRGREENRLVSLRDLASTILDVCGIEPVRKVAGSSLSQLWNGTAEQDIELSPVIAQVAPAGGTVGKPKWWPIHRGTLRSITEDGKHYIRAADGHEEVFDWNADRDETRNLAGEQPELTRQLREKLQQVVRGK